MRTVTARAALLALMAAILAATGVSAQSSRDRFAPVDSIEATLDGEPSRLADASRHHCHDRARPEFRCFRSAEDRNADAAVENDSTDLATAASSGYVIAYSSPSYGGASVVLSQSYSNLGSIGWNDRVSSYKVYTTLTGAFYEHTAYGGLTQYFCCLTHVPYVGNTYNNKFSSFYLP